MKQKNCLKFVLSAAFFPIQPFGQLQSLFRIRIHWVRIRIQHFRLNIDLDPYPEFMTKNWKKITAENIWYFFDQKLQFT